MIGSSSLRTPVTREPLDGDDGVIIQTNPVEAAAAAEQQQLSIHDVIEKITNLRMVAASWQVRLGEDNHVQAIKVSVDAFIMKCTEELSKFGFIVAHNGDLQFEAAGANESHQQIQDTYFSIEAEIIPIITRIEEAAVMELTDSSSEAKRPRLQLSDD